jgi:hypothetical protein
MTDEEFCDCEDCTDSGEPCRCDCEIGEECKGCMDALEERKEIEHEIDCALGRK